MMLTVVGKKLDFGHAVTTNINQLASLIEAWCEVLELIPNFRQNLQFWSCQLLVI